MGVSEIFPPVALGLFSAIGPDLILQSSPETSYQNHLKQTPVETLCAGSACGCFRSEFVVFVDALVIESQSNNFDKIALDA